MVRTYRVSKFEPAQILPEKVNLQFVHNNLEQDPGRSQTMHWVGPGSGPFSGIT